jgi:hypothetical protein
MQDKVGRYKIVREDTGTAQICRTEQELQIR